MKTEQYDTVPEVIWAHESLLADRADEIFLSCMRPGVPRQLVAAGEPFPAARPRTLERPLACGHNGVMSTQGRKRKGYTALLQVKIPCMHITQNDKL